MVTRLVAGLRAIHTKARISIVEEANNVIRVSKQPGSSSIAALRSTAPSASIHGQAPQRSESSGSQDEVIRVNLDTLNVQEQEEPRARVFNKKSNGCALCTCDIPVKISYKDVLILEQFMRVDGTVLPKELTGLCMKQQLRVERCVMQAHWSGLFPDRTHPDLDLAGYKRFKRYWNDDREMYTTNVKTLPGSWYYVKRYNTKTGEFAKPLQRWNTK